MNSDEKFKKICKDYGVFGKILVYDLSDILNDPIFNEELGASAALICLKNVEE